MSDDSHHPRLTDRQREALRTVALESAQKSRVASSFLPLVGPFSADTTTVPSNWLSIVDNGRFPDSTVDRLEIRAGKTLQLVTLACNIHLRGADLSDPGLDAARTMVRRAGEVLGRLEDAVVFHGIPENLAYPGAVRDPLAERLEYDPVVKPLIYTVTGGRDLTGLLQAPDALFRNDVKRSDLPTELARLAEVSDSLQAMRGRIPTDRLRELEAAEDEAEDHLMCVRVPDSAQAGGSGAPVVNAVVQAVEKLERRGHFGPFAVVLGHHLFAAATTPSDSLVLPSDRIAEFLDGRRILRSSVLPPNRGVIVALGGQPVELVLATDIDVQFVQVTLEPRYVVRVFERLVLRIKELDAVCCVTSGEPRLAPRFVPRKARS